MTRRPAMPHTFAYGSNLSVPQMAARCPSGVVVGVGVLRDHRLAFNRYSPRWIGGVADAVASDGGEVWGLVWSLSEENLGALDAYEDVPRGYVRLERWIAMRDGGRIHAWVYSVADKSPFVAPRKEYLAIIVGAALRFDFPVEYRALVQATPTID